MSERPRAGRRRLLSLVLLALGLVAPEAVLAQERAKLPHVGVLLLSSEDADGRRAAGTVREGLRSLGWVEGQNVVLRPKFANRSRERLAVL